MGIMVAGVYFSVYSVVGGDTTGAEDMVDTEGESFLII